MLELRAAAIIYFDIIESWAPTVADAILDRLVHNAHRMTLTGESMRKDAAKRAGLDAKREA